MRGVFFDSLFCMWLILSRIAKGGIVRLKSSCRDYEIRIVAEGIWGGKDYGGIRIVAERIGGLRGR